MSLWIIPIVIFLSYSGGSKVSGSSPIGGCHDGELGMENGYILDRDITSSSFQNASTPAKNARLNYIEGSSWCAAANDSKPYLQIELDRPYIICAVSTQGNSKGDQWVNTYTLQSSKDETTWTDYREAGIIKIFNGNIDQNKTVKNILCDGIVATGLRITVEDYNANCCMRVELYGVPLTRDNLAQDKPTSQSSSYTDGKVTSDNSGYAVDGVKDTHFSKCTRTDLVGKGTDDPWWRVNLEQWLPVSELYILNRGDCCGDRLKGFEIRVGDATDDGGISNELCASGLSVPQGKGRFFRCNSTIYGRYVYIRIPGARKILTLCEVEVYSTITSNLALKRPTKQSSSKHGGTPERAVDGIRSTYFEDNSCTRTKARQQPPWWRVDLGSSLPVAEVIVVNRACAVPCAERLKEFEIRIGDDRTNGGISNPLCGGLHGLESGETQAIYCRPRLFGQFLFIRIPGAKKTLTLCEVEVYSKRRVTNGCQTQEVGVANRLLTSSFSASSSHLGDEPARGRLNGEGAWSPSSNNDIADYLQIDLGEMFFICAVATQGHALRDEWTTSYKLHLFLTHWIVYRENDTDKIFSGNSGRKETVKHVLDKTVKTQVIRFQPINYSIHKALRVEVYGIKIPAGKPSAPKINNEQTQVSECDVSLVWDIPESNGCSLTMYTVYYREQRWNKEDDSWNHINITADTRSLNFSSLKCNIQYVFRVSAWNEVGESDMSRDWSMKAIKVNDVVPTAVKNPTGRTVGIVVAVVGIIFIAVMFIGYKERRKQKEARGNRRSKSDIVPLLLKEVPPQRVTFMEELGRGAFGKVHKGKLRDQPKPEVFFKPREERVGIVEERVIAIKVLFETASEEGKEEFLREIEFMKDIGSHRNVLSMLGYWVKSEPIMLILEYVPHGDLLQWLRSKRQKIKIKKSVDEGLLKESKDKNGLQRTDDKTKTYEETGAKHDEKINGRGAGNREDIHAIGRVKQSNKEFHTENATRYYNVQSIVKIEARTPASQDVCEPSKCGSDAMKQSGKETIEEETNILQGDQQGAIDDNFSASDLLSFAWQITKGMDYLASKGFVHRDLAARNVLLGENRVVKIADFGLLRHTYGEMYEMKKTKKVPIKWMAPEALHNGIYTSKSDVWSFGVLLWELSTMGGIPYPGISNNQLYKLLKTGYHMEKPDMCSDELYVVMLDCWKENPDERPSFEHLISTLEQMMIQGTPYYDFNKLDEAQACYNEAYSDSDESGSLDTKL